MEAAENDRLLYLEHSDIHLLVQPSTLLEEQYNKVNCQIPDILCQLIQTNTMDCPFREHYLVH